MSSIGLNTNTFRITGKYLQMLNDFVVKAKMNEDIDEAQKDHLVDFITKLKDEDSTQPQYQLLSSIVERELRSKNSSFQEYLESIITEIGKNDTSTFLPKVEFLADVLDMENSVALAKIVGE